MFQTKEQKIKSYLARQRSVGSLTAFDALLAEQVGGAMQMRLGLERPKFHIDW